MGGGVRGNFGNTKGSRLDALSDFLTAASLIPGLDTLADLAAIPVDLLRGDFLSAGLDAFGVFPFIGEIADTSKLAKIANKVSNNLGTGQFLIQKLPRQFICGKIIYNLYTCIMVRFMLQYL